MTKSEVLLRHGGSGKKALQVLEGVADVYMHLGPMTKRWDTCPTDVFVRAFDGYFGGIDGKEYEYDETSKDHHNHNGVLVCLNKDAIPEIV